MYTSMYIDLYGGVYIYNIFVRKKLEKNLGVNIFIRCILNHAPKTYYALITIRSLLFSLLLLIIF